MSISPPLLLDDLSEEIDGILGQGTLEFMEDNHAKERESSEYIRSWSKATRGDSLVLPKSIDTDSTPDIMFEIVFARTIESPNKKKHVAYTLMVRSKGAVEDPHPAVIERRYTDFLSLYNKLKKDFPPHMASLAFPKKALLGNFTPEMISSRSASFEEFLNFITTTPQVRDSPSIISFLQNRELQEAIQLIQDDQLDQAKPLVENCFWLMNKLQTDRAPVVLRALCLLVGITYQGRDPRALGLAALALRRFQGVCDTDLLKYYVPLLHTTIDLCQLNGKECQNIQDVLHDLKRKGVRVDPKPSLLESVLEDITHLPTN